MDTANETPLSPWHLAMLRASAISEAVIRARGYRTVIEAEELAGLGFKAAQRRVPGLLLPLHTTDGGNGLYVYRPDNPRVVEDRSRRERSGDGLYGAHPCKVIKYELPPGSGVRLDCPPPCRPLLGDPSVPLWVTEGQKKADALVSSADEGQMGRIAVVGLLGVWNFSGKNPLGGVTFLNDWNYIALNGRAVYIAFDSDLMSKPQVAQALERLTEHLQRRGARVAAVYLPPGPGGARQGVDDFLAAGHSLAELEALAQAPRPLPQPAPPQVELLDTPPLELRRPLALMDTPEGRRAYAAAWLPVRRTVREKRLKSGEVVRLDPPEQDTRIELFVIRDDGTAYGEGGERPLEALPFGVRLPEPPPRERLWTAAGVRRYRAGQRPDPVDVFRRAAAVVDRFIDFDRSLAPQEQMAELLACYVLATWLLDAFNVIGFLWPNGDRGSGKTHLLLVVAELGYLGQVVLAGGSFACLRDMADCGATLAFDDAENLANPHSSDPDKRALLLAGNRRGVTVPLKELAPDKTWRTRHVNAFCPRLFSAIRLPDPILASRTIVIPLVRTPDRARANSDPLDAAAWPCDRRLLADDLWAMALAGLPELPAWDAWVAEHAQLAGRALQPWRAVLAVAAWLESKGAGGLFGRMEALSLGYQVERQELETDDLTVLVLRGLVFYVDALNERLVQELSKEKPAPDSIRAICAIESVCFRYPHHWDLSTETIVLLAKQSAIDLEAELDLEQITSRRVGKVMAKLRASRLLRAGGRGPRRWRVTLEEMIKWTSVYGIPFSSLAWDEGKSEIEDKPSGGCLNQTAQTAQMARMARPCGLKNAALQSNRQGG